MDPRHLVLSIAGGVAVLLTGIILFGRKPRRSGRRLLTQDDLCVTEKRILMKISELNGVLTQVETTLGKVQAEIKLLQERLADAEIPADAQASLDRLAALATALDELNPDAATDEPVDGTL